MPIDEHISGPSAGAIVYIPPNQPGTPTWLGNAEREIDITFDRADNGPDTEYIVNIEEDGDNSYYVNAVNIYAANDTLTFTSDRGGPVSINVTAGDLTPSTASIVLEDLMNANTTLTGSGKITFSIINDANKFTIDAGATHWISLTYSSSDGAETWGFTGDAAAAQSITSDTYALFNKMVGTEGWRAISTDLAGIIRVMGLSSLTSPSKYRFRVKARNSWNTALETAYSDWSEIMVPRINLALSDASNNMSFECTTGKCKISGLTVTALGDSYPGQYTIAYTLTRVNVPATKNNVKIYYSTNGSSYTEMTGTVNTFGDNTSQFDITVATANYSTTYTYDGTGTSPLFVTNGLVAGHMITINSSTFNAANNGSFRVLSVSETAITVENGSGVAETNKVLSANDSMTSAVSIGGAITSLTASAAGTANSNKWASCVILGNSYNSTIYIKVVPYDTATSGSAGTEAITTIAVDNRPKSISIAEFSDFDWDSDTTPEVVADIASIVCGSYLYFVAYVTNNTTGEEKMYSSAERPAGWYYEADHAGNPGSDVRHAETGWDTGWTACTYLGVDATLAPPAVSGNRIRYIFQEALSQGTTYTIVLKQAEYVSELV